MKRVGQTGLFVLGLTLGIVGMSTSEWSNALRHFQYVENSAHSGATLATSCVQKDTSAQKDDLFFVSCGGIY